MIGQTIKMPLRRYRHGGYRSPGFRKKYRPVAIDSSFSQTPGIRRQPACACGGGCPRCSGIIQPKLTIARPYDRYEQEADRVADQILRMPDSEIQRKPT